MLTGIVLAGGRSSRMGRDKALLEWRGATLLDRAIALLGAAGADRVVVSGERPAHGGVPDVHPHAGPVGALASVLPTCADGVLVAVPVDMPELDPATLAALVAALRAAPAACYDGHPLPWAACVGPALRAAVGELMAARPDGPSMRALHARLGGIALPVADPRRLANVNTPADWAALAQ